MYKAHSCTTEFQPDIRESSPGYDGASKEVDPFIGAADGVEDGGSGEEATAKGYAKGGSRVEDVRGGRAGARGG